MIPRFICFSCRMENEGTDMYVSGSCVYHHVDPWPPSDGLAAPMCLTGLKCNMGGKRTAVKREHQLAHSWQSRLPSIKVRAAT